MAEKNYRDMTREELLREMECILVEIRAERAERALETAESNTRSAELVQRLLELQSKYPKA